MAGADDKKPDEGEAAGDGKPAEKLGVDGKPQTAAGDIEVSEVPDDDPVSTSLSTLAAPPKTEPSKIDEAQEKTRGLIAGALVAVLLIIIIASFATVWWTSLTVDDVKGLLEVILAPVVALVGSATGFYFGGKK